jgi:drug/metabolite transporter (DMT)-like permease
VEAHTKAASIAGEDVSARRRHARGLAMLMVVVLAWGTAWPVNKALLAYMPPLWSLALRSIVSALALFAISVTATGLVMPRKDDAPVLISMVGLHMVGFAVLATLALQFVPAGRSTVLAYTSVLWAPLFAAVFLGERVSLRRAAGLALGLMGLAVIFNPLTFDWSDGNAVFGNAALLAGALLWGVSIVHNRAHVWRATPFQLAPWQALLAAAILTGVAVLAEGAPAIDWNVRSVLLLLFAGIPGTALAYWAAAVSSSDLPAATTSIGLLGTPAVSVIVSMIMLGEEPTVALIVALVLILAGVVVGMSVRAS